MVQGIESIPNRKKYYYLSLCQSTFCQLKYLLLVKIPFVSQNIRKQKMKQNNQSPTIKHLAEGRYSYSHDDLLGRGATGNVYKGVDRNQNKQVAIKVIQTGKMNQVEKNLIQNQKKALKIIKHSNIMKLFHIQEDPTFTYIVSEIYQGGSLKEHLQKKGSFKQQQGMQFFRKVVNGYCSIVESNIIHRDLKPANILLTKTQQPIIIDFGYSQIIVANKNITVFNVGSPSYMSPEAYKKTIYSQKSDVWSLGAIFYQILTGQTLDKGLTINKYFQTLEKHLEPLIKWDSFGEITRQILKGCLSLLPENRMTSHRIKYLLDKQIIGKQLCAKTKDTRERQHEKKPSFNNSAGQSKGNLNLLLKSVDFAKLKQSQDHKTVKNPALIKASSSVSSPENLYDNYCNVQKQKQFDQMIKKIQLEKQSQKTANTVSIKQIKPVPLNKTPPISPINSIEFKNAKNCNKNEKNSCSSINYVSRNAQNNNAASALVYAPKDYPNNNQTTKLNGSQIKKEQIPSRPISNATLMTNNDYCYDNRKDYKNLTVNNNYFKQPLNENSKHLQINLTQNSINREREHNQKKMSNFTDPKQDYNSQFNSQHKIYAHNENNFTQNTNTNAMLVNSHQKTSSKLLDRNNLPIKSAYNHTMSQINFRQKTGAEKNQTSCNTRPDLQPKNQFYSLNHEQSVQVVKPITSICRQFANQVPTRCQVYKKQSQQSDNLQRQMNRQNTQALYHDVKNQQSNINLHSDQYRGSQKMQSLFSDQYRGFKNVQDWNSSNTNNLYTKSNLDPQNFQKNFVQSTCKGQPFYVSQNQKGNHYNNSSDYSKKIISLRKLI